MAVDKGNKGYDYTLSVSWNGENINSGVLNNNGDHVYRFHFDFGDVKRNHYITIKGKILKYYIVYCKM